MPLELVLRRINYLLFALWVINNWDKYCKYAFLKGRKQKGNLPGMEGSSSLSRLRSPIVIILSTAYEY